MKKQLYVKPAIEYSHIETNFLCTSIKNADDENREPVIKKDLDEGDEVGAKGWNGGWDEEAW